NNAMDFDDLIVKMVYLLKESQNALDYVNDRFKYVMVDEYQDTNTAQFELVRLLAGPRRNLCVVGDDDQSIYKFRGANIYNILNFEKYFPDAKVIKLEENYRSTGTILAAANAVIKNNKGRKEKALWTKKDEGEYITLKVLDNGYEEAEYIVDTIVRAHRQGEDFNKNAVLYRTNAQSRTLEEKFVNAGVPYKIVGGINFYSRKEIKDVLAYLRCINNTSDDISVRRILNVPKRGIGQTSVNKVIDYAEGGGISFYDALCEADDIPTLGAAAKKIKGFVNLIRIIRAFEEDLSVHELIQKLLDESGYLEELKAEDKVEQTDRAENVEELVNKAADFDAANPNGTLSEFLQEVALVADIDSLDENQDYVVLMTLHGAKGLEFPRVFLAGMEDGLFPSFMSITADNSDEELEEERRLCYVGITRAMEKLFITAARTRMVRGEIQYGKLSRFVKEIPEELFGGDKPSNVKKEREVPNYTPRSSVYGRSYSGGGLSAADFLKSTGTASGASAATTARTSYTARSLSSVATKGAPVSGKPDYVVGDRVHHIKFGDGTVLSLVNGGRDYEVTVQFDSAGTKKMFAGFAKLQKI
ncbi:MAG: UvrD-helicase domain-containing protein, partial [Lachnospiraceae bacterium]|nr:UvrD-helicase domain-containing protein [Lachnospiraceae bacterium]